jgi:ArsR family transcriptional regulator
MAVSLPVLTPRERVAGGCCTPAAAPDVGEDEAARLATIAKALADPTRVRILDALRKSAPEAPCQCELVPLFDMSQQALSKHLNVLVGAGVVGSARRGLWTYYFILPGALEELKAWLN